MQCQRSEEFKKVVRQVQSAQQDLVCVSDYHVLAASRFFEMEILETRRAMTQLGCKFWPGMELGSRQGLIPELPHAKSDLCSIVFQFSHQIAPLFYSERKKWSVWLDQVNDCEGRAIKPQQYTKFMYDYLLNYFDAADKIVNQALEKLRERGYQQPKRHHIFQTASKMNDQVPLLLLKAALEMKMEDLQDQSIDVCPLIDAINSYQLESEEKLGFWGYHDCGFVVKVGQRGQRHVIMKGARYELCGSSLSKLLPFIESEMQVQINPLKEFSPVSPVWSQTSDSRFSDSEKELLYDSFPQTSFSTVDRVRHGTGHSQEDIFLIRTGSSFRIPDAVVWPQCESDVEKLVGVAKDKRWCLIPFGGGTNVSNATRCPASDVEHRPIISVDMKQMRRILWINEEDGLAHIEAGITGRELVEELEQQGLTMGHEPDSYEFSTLGGWVATKASGMKRSKYGNIEDIVKSVRVIGPDGLLWEGSENSVSTPGRVAEGLDLCSLVMGSEGCIGIITSAVIRVWPLPEVREYDSVIIRNFQEGLQFVRAIARLGPNKPASVRLLDNAHFRLGQALRPEESSILRQFTKSIIQFASSAISTYDPASIVCATINYEGSIAEIKAQKRTIREIASSHGGMMLGSQIGKAGYELTFMIAYLRDFAMTYHLLGESFETFVPWSRIETLISATKEKIAQEHVSRFLPGKPFVGCRVTQLYHEGVCLYFYLCFSFEGVDNASEIFSELEKAARSEILKQGGSLSHHHGIGKLRAPLLKERVSPALSKSIDSIKQAIDNDNIFGARNGHFATLK
jgi:alkyldihydroxyacetonephosphate synthase